MSYVLTAAAAGAARNDSRLRVNSALMPPLFRYREKRIEELRKMKPLDELPEALIPGRVPGINRLPPLLRKGYPITRETICRLVEEAGFSPVSEGDLMVACLNVAQILSVQLKWPIGCSHVYGIPGPEEEAIIIPVSESYAPEYELPAKVQEQLKQQLQVEGPAKWYLDSVYSQWDWKDIYGII